VINCGILDFRKWQLKSTGVTSLKWAGPIGLKKSVGRTCEIHVDWHEMSLGQKVNGPQWTE